MADNRREVPDPEGTVKSLIVDLNDLMKNMAAGQYIRFADIAVQMSKKLMSLKDAIRQEKEDHERQVENLMRLNNELAEKAFEKDGGTEDGSAFDPEEREGI